jgi:excisionase family DNA binding protein
VPRARRSAPGDEEYLSISEAARRLGVHPATLRGWADKGLVPHIKLPTGYRRFAPSAIQKLRQEMGMEETEGKVAA